MADFKLPDPKKASGKVLGLGLLGGLGLLFYAKILPFLNNVVWGTVELAIGIGVASVVGYVLLSPKFWRRTRIVLDALGEIIFGWFVEMNKFTILQLQIDKADKDREDLMKQNSILAGQEDRLVKELAENSNLMQVSAQEIKICQKKLSSNPADEDTALALESSTVNFNNAKDFVDTVQPIHNDIKKLVTFTEKAYRKSGNALKNARNTLSIQKRKYEAVTQGSSAVKKALRAFAGDPEMNKAGAIALDKLSADIALKIGTIRTTIRATSDIMNEKDLRDAAKVNLATQTVEQLNIDEKFDYSTSLGAEVGSLPLIENKSKYLYMLKQK